ncbi:hypothetical protein, partial [Enterocloster citroniae]
AYSLLDQKREEIIIDVLNNKDIRIDIRLLLIQCLLEYGIIPDINNPESIIDNIQPLKRILNPTLKGLLVSFCELLAYKKYKPTTILSLLQLPGDCIPEYRPRFFDRIREEKEYILLFDTSCRIATLQAVLTNKELNPEDFLPPRVKDKLTSKDYDEKERAEDDKRDFNRLYNFALPYYKLRIDICLSVSSQDSFKKRFDALTTQTKDDWQLRHYQNDIVGLFDFFACRFLDILPLVEEKEHFLNQIHTAFIRNKENKNTRILTTTADRISKINDDKIHKLVLKFFNQADKVISNDLLTLDDINDYYLKATRALNRIDPAFGKRFFLKAIEVVHNIDDNAFHQIRTIHTISNVGLPEPSPEIAFEFGRFVEYTKTILSGYDHFPTRESLYTLVNIDPGSALAYLCRWDHRNVIELDTYAGDVLDKLHECGYIDGVCNAALWPLSPYFNFDTPFFRMS